MPPIRLKDKYSEHFSLGTDEHDGTTTVNCHYTTVTRNLPIMAARHP